MTTTQLIPDENLRTAIKTKLGIDNTNDITEKEMTGLEDLVIPDSNIASLEGL